MCEIQGVVVSYLGRDREIGAEERAAEFGHQLLESVGLIAEAPAEGASVA
jgi:hypothetical protein